MTKLTGREAGIALLQGKVVIDKNEKYLYTIDRENFVSYKLKEDIFWTREGHNDFPFFDLIMQWDDWELYEPEEEKKAVIKTGYGDELVARLDQDLQAQQDTIDQLEQEVKDKTSYALSLEEKVIELEAKNKNLKAQNFLLELMFATPEEVAEQKESWEEVKKTLKLGE